MTVYVQNYRPIYVMCVDVDNFKIVFQLSLNLACLILVHLLQIVGHIFQLKK